ncbi:MAG: hypothetical protein IT233_08220 [Bacteroidia bacterium]|nr:hypothetical protein [Bacteroidia bacterium]
MRKIFLLLGFLTFIATSCRKDQGPISLHNHSHGVSYTNDIQPIWNANCISCHDETHFALNLKSCCSWYELMTTGLNAPYVDTVTPSASVLHMRLAGTQLPAMPPGNPLTQAEIDLVFQWIEEGAKNN